MSFEDVCWIKLCALKMFDGLVCANQIRCWFEDTSWTSMHCSSRMHIEFLCAQRMIVGIVCVQRIFFELLCVLKIVARLLCALKVLARLRCVFCRLSCALKMLACWTFVCTKHVLLDFS